MPIFGIILKAILEQLSSKLVPKAETFVKFYIFDTIFNAFLFQNLVFYSILWGSPSAARGSQKAAQIADTSADLLVFCVIFVFAFETGLFRTSRTPKRASPH